jgi:GT2 family glycosyltransferase
VTAISIVIPAYYSARTLAGCLRALRAQSRQDFEVIIVSSSPEAETEALVRAQFPEVKLIVSGTRLLPHAARNRGVQESTGERLVFTDPDCRPRADWLERLLAAVPERPALVGGSIEQARNEWVTRGIHRCKFPYSHSTQARGARAMLPTANVCMTRAAWREIGPFDGDVFCGDTLICQRAHARGIPVLFEPTAVVEHVGSPSFRQFVRERLDRGAEFAKARAARGQWSHHKQKWLGASAPLRLANALGKTAVSAHRAGVLDEYLTELPIHLVGQLAWTVGETKTLSSLR